MTKYYVITIDSNPHSLEAARRCIDSAKKLGIKVEHFWANTPENTDLDSFFLDENLPDQHFKEVYSRWNPVRAAFSSHYSLWKKCWTEKLHDFVILEHDAVFIDKPKRTSGDIVNLGQPSYGNYNNGAVLGEQPLFSKRYLPGAHAYKITPNGAKQLIERARFDAGPTDVFIHIERFSNITELFPWPIEAKDWFTTIQNENGCRAKHNYNEKYEIV